MTESKAPRGANRAYKRFLLQRALPHFWCPGCGNGVVLGAIVRALASLGLSPSQVVVVTGIGCWGKADDYLNVNALHGTHGRALPLATGVKVNRPDLTVLALMGDGDCATIGGNHLLHSARRNIGVKAIVVNNLNYGMTGGQYSSTTPGDKITSTSPFGDPERGLDIAGVAAVAGANYVARSTVYHAAQTETYIKEAITAPGFGLVEVLSTCPTYFGRLNSMRTAVESMNWLKSAAVTAKAAGGMSPDDLRERIVIGRFCSRTDPDFNQRYEEIRQRARDRGFRTREVVSGR
ncbi:MAG: 2-oxoacid:ferredoxin oxidoreductase subunit beta [Firmicutes bacterium]|nr:2-oxoacid:ferredoxin oxidoreductase subunit beta [Bacillota bacterium]